MVSVSLTENNLRRIRNHQPFQLTHRQLLGGPHRLNLKPNKVRRVETAVRKQKGIRLHLEPTEMRGLGIMDSLRDAYNTQVRPRVRPALHRGVQRIAPAIQRRVQSATQPVVGRRAARHLASGATSAIHFGVDRVGDLSGAYGIKEDLRRFHRRAKPAIRKALQGVVKTGLRAVAPLAGPAAPLANQLIDQYSDRVVGKVGDLTGGWGRGRMHGGSFLPVGYR